MITFRVPDMTCGHCASVITMAVAGVDKAARIEIDVPAKLVSITSTAAERRVDGGHPGGRLSRRRRSRPRPRARPLAACGAAMHAPAENPRLLTQVKELAPAQQRMLRLAQELPMDQPALLPLRSWPLPADAIFMHRGHGQLLDR